MIFLGPSLFGLQINDSNPNFQSVNKKRVHHETYKRFWKNLPSNFTKKFIFQNKKFTSPFSLHLFYKSKNAYTIGSLWNYDPFKQYSFITPIKFPGRSLMVSRETLFSIDSAHIDLDCNAITNAQPYRHLSKVYDHPLLNRALKIQNVFASQHYSESELLFLTAESVAFVSENQYCNANSQCQFSISFLCSSYFFCKSLWKQFWNWTC